MITIILLAFAGIFNAIMDTIKSPTYYDKSIFPKTGKWSNFLDHRKSSSRKWKPGTTNQERFLGSSTIFVMFTDGWHLAQAFMIFSFVGAIPFYTPYINIWWDIVGMIAVMTGMFQLFFGVVFRK